MAKSSKPAGGKSIINPPKIVTNQPKIAGKNSSNIPTFQTPLPPPTKPKTK